MDSYRVIYHQLAPPTTGNRQHLPHGPLRDAQAKRPVDHCLSQDRNLLGDPRPPTKCNPAYQCTGSPILNSSGLAG